MTYSRLVVAVDPEKSVELDSLISRISSFCNEVYGVKVGLPFTLLYGLRGIGLLREACRARLIADFKLADVAHVMVRSVEPLAGLVDAVIAHSFVGTEGALDGLKKFLDSRGIDLILVVSMSHPGSLEVIDENLDRLLAIAEKLEPWGVVAPATRPSVVKKVKSRLRDVKVLSPGVGAQGARPGDALRAGADYEIVGRAVMEAEDPLEAVRLINLEHKKVLEGRSP